MAVAINPREQLEYVLLADRELGNELQTVFLLRPLTNIQRKLVEDQSLTMDAHGAVKPRVGSVKIEALRAALAGWRNFHDAAGVAVPFETEQKKLSILGSMVDPPTVGTINRLNPRDLEEIVDAIMGNAHPTIVEGKG